MLNIYLTSVLFFLVHCSTPQSNHYFELPLIEKFVQLSSIEPPPPIIAFSPVYLQASNDSICEISFDRLYVVYKNTFKDKYSKYPDFLFDALNQKIRMDTENPQNRLYFSHIFFKDLNIEKLYKEKGLKGIIDKYCLRKDDSYTLIKSNLSMNMIMYVSYLFFLNQYLRYDDDYYGTIGFRKISKI